MPDDNILKVGAEVSVQPIKSGMQEAADATTEATERMSRGFSEVSDAAEAAAETVAKAGSASQAAATGHREAAAAVDGERQSLTELLQATVAQTTATEALNAAGVQSAAVHQAVTGAMEAESSVATTLMGALGSVGLTLVAATLVSKLGDLYNEFVLNSSGMGAMVEESKKLTAEFAAAVAATDALMKKQAEFRERDDAMRKAGFDPTSGKAPTREQLEAGERGAREGGAAFQLGRDKNAAAELAGQYVYLTGVLERYHSIARGEQNGIVEGRFRNANIPADRAAAMQGAVSVQERIDTNVQQQKAAELKITEDHNQEVKARQEEDAKDAEIKAQLARQAAAQTRALVAQKKAQDHADKAEEQAEARQAYQAQVEAMQANVAQIKAAAEEDDRASDNRIVKAIAVYDATVDFYGKGSKEAAEANRELTRTIREVDQAQAQLEARQARQAAIARRPAETAQTGIVQQATVKGAGTDQLARQELAENIITQQQYVQIVQQTENAVYAIKMDALQKRRALEAQDPNGVQEVQRTDNEIEALELQHQARITQIHQAEQQKRIQAVNAFSQAFVNSTANMLANWERGNASLTQSFARAMGNMLLNMQASLLQQRGAQLAHYVLIDKMHLASAATKRSTDMASAATAKATSASEATTEGNNAAITAAKHAYASTSAIPIIGPILAPVAAAGAFVAVEALGMASAAGGWAQVPADGMLTELHKDEMVLPGKLADSVRNMTDPGGDTHIHMGDTSISGSVGNLPQMWDAHEDAMIGKLKSLKRDGKI